MTSSSESVTATTSVYDDEWSFFVIGSSSTLPMFIWSSLRRTIDPSINTISTLLMAVTLALWVLAFLFTIRAERTRLKAREAL